MNTVNPYAKSIAKAALEIKAIELRPNQPFLWASGTYNPIYNDNRMLLGSFQHRMLVCKGLLQAIKQAGWQNADYICGTSLSGIAPAASVIDMYEKLPKPHLLVLHKDELYIDTRLGFLQTYRLPKAICSTTPFAIPAGVEFANEAKIPFMYVRPQQKQHGKGKIIEGMPHTQQTTLLVATDMTEVETYLPILQEQNIVALPPIEKSELINLKRWNAANNPLEKETSLVGKKVIVIEDLISTGGSSLKEVTACREGDAEVLGVISIFNYGLESAQKAFAEANCPVHSVLTYDTLLEVAKEEKMFSESQLQLLASWRPNQPNWGEKNGFPAEPKK